MLDWATKIDFSDAEKVQRLKAEFPRLVEGLEYLKTQEPFSPHWSWALLFLFLEYGRNIKKLAPVAGKINVLLFPLVWGVAEGISYAATKLYIREKEINIPFVDKIVQEL